MKDLEILAKAFQYIEENLQDEIKTQDVALSENHQRQAC